MRPPALLSPAINIYFLLIPGQAAYSLNILSSLNGFPRLHNPFKCHKKDNC